MSLVIEYVPDDVPLSDPSYPLGIGTRLRDTETGEIWICTASERSGTWTKIEGIHVVREVALQGTLFSPGVTLELMSDRTVRWKG